MYYLQLVYQILAYFRIAQLNVQVGTGYTTEHTTIKL